MQHRDPSDALELLRQFALELKKKKSIQQVVNNSNYCLFVRKNPVFVRWGNYLEKNCVIIVRYAYLKSINSSSLMT